MKLYYAHTLKGNFGDDLNPYIFTRLFPGLLDENHAEILVGIGTILNHKVPKEPFKYVFGSGFGYGGRPDFSSNRWKVYCVRGPHTAARLKLDLSLAATDPAILVSRYIPHFNGKSSGYGFIPHFESLDVGFWPDAASQAGLRFINPRASVNEVISGIQSCEVVITESLHGAIVADCLRIPWIAIRPIVESHRKKWFDWASSLEITLQAKQLVPSSQSEARNALWNRIRGPVKTLLASNFLTQGLLNGSPQTEALEFHRNDKNSPQLFKNMSNITHSPRRPPSTGDMVHIERAACRLRELRQCAPQLSTDLAFARALTRLDDAANRLRRDFHLDSTEK
jgi:hypothetical protein